MEQMGSVLLNHNEDFIDDTSEEQFLSPVSSNIYNVFGDPELFPRIGEQYQVEIPPIIAESEYLFYKKNPFEVEFAPGVSCDFLVGLPIPIMCINMENEHSKHEGLEFLGGSNGTSNRNGLLKSETNKEVHISSKFKAELVDIAWENGLCSGESANLGLEHGMKRKMHQKCRGVGYRLVPGSLGGSWSDIEEASFLLGLYIFGKNLVQVKKFIEFKSMGDIQSFYYGKFYRSDEYRRWSDCRKMRSRRCVYGQRIFTGLRQQELLSRLFLHVSEECQTTLMEVSKTFGEGKMSLEEYVFTLKAIVGMNSLVEAVGIGKGKRDLTGITIEPSKSNNVGSTRPEIPIGKACSSLTPEEIIKFLTGDFRLSKARSNDLFWEAVWPRLLARGWHSEQPKDQSYAAGLKHSLVFLMPGVKKFSRRRLRRGNQYFDSVTDVLSKVAADPSLIDLDSEVVDSNENKEAFGWTSETNLEQDDLSDRRRHCYLQPRIPNRGTDLMKFTIVDTSLAYGKTFKVRELRTLPDEVSKKAVFRNHSEESAENSSEVSSEDSDSADAMLIDREYTNNAKSAKRLSAIDLFSENKDLEIGVSNQWVNGLDSGNVKPSLVSQSDSGNASFKNSKGVNHFCENKQPRKSLKCRLKQDDLNYIGPVMKRRRRLSACTQAESSHHLLSFSVRPSLEQEKHICSSEATDSSENNLSGMGSSQKRVSSTSSSKGSLVESTEGISCDTNIGTVGPNDEPQPRTLIDLNFPQVSTDFETGEASMLGLRDRQDFETGEASMMGLRDRQDDTISKPENSTAPKVNADVTSSEQQPNTNSRRQSTRNRPPTARALEALVNGFLTTNRRQKNKDACPRKKSTSKPPRCARDGMEVTEDFSSATVASQMVEVGNGESNDKSNMFQTFQVRSEGKVAQVTGPQISITGSFQL